LRLAGIRQFHAYLGAFIAPSILFFALTGSLQLFNLHEAHGTYRPPVLIEKLSAVHKDQRFTAKPMADDIPAPKAAHQGGGEQADADSDDDRTAQTPGVQTPGGQAPAGKAPGAKPAKGAPGRSLVLKWLFLAVAMSLIVSTCLGIWMAVTYSRRKGVVWALLILGAALPILILVV
jgi:hypothetical protein